MVESFCRASVDEDWGMVNGWVKGRPSALTTAVSQDSSAIQEEMK
jgi:hypothetical protein